MMHGDFRYVPGLGLGKEGDYLTDRLTDEAIKVIEDPAVKPFFLYMAYYTVHVPIEAKPEIVEYYKRKVKPGMRHTNPTYAAMVQSMDENVGRILQSLEKRGVSDRTIVIFTSDNGGLINKWGSNYVVTNNAPLRSGKGSLYEGGVRVPLIILWPGVTKAGSISHEPVVLTDLYPTMIAAAGLVPTSGDSQFDSIDLLPLVENSDTILPRDALYWHYPHYYSNTSPVSSMRTGEWKLLEYLEDNRLELYNLHEDPGEQNNLVNSMPERTAKLHHKLNSWRMRVNAQMPTR
jgi:arylsulfatase A-like enzyme